MRGPSTPLLATPSHTSFILAGRGGLNLHPSSGRWVGSTAFLHPDTAFSGHPMLFLTLLFQTHMYLLSLSASGYYLSLVPPALSPGVFSDLPSL